MTSEKNITIGRGLIARELCDVDFGRRVLVFASGVSDSSETKIDRFRRESDLLERVVRLYSNLHALYFSTCSVSSGIETPYITHKLAMEKQLLASTSSCHIFRLPQVVGLVHNRTLVSYFVDAILHGRILKVQSQSKRNLLDIRDFVRVSTMIVRRGAGTNKPHNIASSTQVPVLDIVTEIARLLGKRALIEMVDGGYSQNIDVSFMRSLLREDDSLLDPGHWMCVLQHYVPLIAADLKKR